MRSTISYDRGNYVCLHPQGGTLIMGMDSPISNQMTTPTQVWVHLSTDLQLQVVHLLAQLAAHFVLAQVEPVQQVRKESTDGLSSVTEQAPA